MNEHAEAVRFPAQPCEECVTPIQQAVHDLHVELHPDGGRICAECRQIVLLVAEALNGTSAAPKVTR